VQALCKTFTTGIKGRERSADEAHVLARAYLRADARSLRLAQPAIRSTSRFEVTAVGGLLLSAAGLWLLVIPVELLGLIA
jgi:hypothetical protein